MAYWKKKPNRYTFADPGLKLNRGFAGNPKRRILYINTGEIYPSVTAASEATGVSQPDISRIARGHKECVRGHKFEYYIEPQKGGNNDT